MHEREDTMRKLVRRLGVSIMSLAWAGSVSAQSASSISTAQPGEHFPRPVLGTPEQIQTEATLVNLLGDPQIAAVRRSMAAELGTTPTGRTADGASMLDRAVWQWTSSSS